MAAKLNRAVRTAAAALAVIAVGAGATACNASSDDASSKAGSSSSAGKQGGSGDAAKGAGEGAGGAKKTAEKGSRTDAVNTSSASGASTSTRCHTGELDFKFGGPHGGRPDMDTTQQQVASVQLMNTGQRTCTLHGFPGVQLVSEAGETWDLRRSGDTPSTVKLGPGDTTASVSMNILPVAEDSEDAEPFVPSKVVITPPDEKANVTLEWPYGGAVLDQSGATRPGTFVNPVGF